jgi:cobalt-precorrin 5A hydrolase
VQQCLQQALALAGGTLADVAVLASIEAKADEAAFLQLAQQHGLPLQWFTAAQLAAVPVPNPSATVQRYMGTPSVSEAAALLAAQADLRALVVEKHKLRGPDGKNATVSIARMPCLIASSSPGPSTTRAPSVQAELVEARHGACPPPVQAGPVEACHRARTPPVQAELVEARHNACPPPVQAEPVEALRGASTGSA